MEMFSYMNKIDLALRNDETLLRLLYYKSTHFSDDPLDKNKPNVLDRNDITEILNHRIKFTPVVDDLTEDSICRLIFYPTTRMSTANYQTSSQHITFDIFTHYEYNDVDMRLSKICDYLNNIIFNKKISGLGKSYFVKGDGIKMPDMGYAGYSMTYEFGSLN